MKLKWIICGIICTFSGYVFAQESDDKALDILSKLAGKSDAYSEFYTEFTFRVESKKDSNTNSFGGEMWYKDGDYRLDINETVVYSDGETNWTYLKDIEEVNITENMEDESSLIDPHYLLNNYETAFKCRFISDKFEHNRPLYEIDMYPVDIESATYSRLKLFIDKAKNELFAFVYMGKDGTDYRITMKKTDISSAIPDSVIHFSKDAYPNAEIIDMRE